MDLENLAGATVIVVEPGDSLTFVTSSRLEDLGFEDGGVLAQLREWFPDVRIGLIGMVSEVIHAKPEPQ